MKLPRAPLGRTGLEVTPLALAAGGSGGGHGKLTPDDVERAFHEHGINTFFVTSYMRELAEGIRRLVRAGHRDELVLISIASLPFGWSIPRAWERQARALGVETIDIFLLGWIQGRWYLAGRCWPAVLRLREEGKVGAVGYSIHKRKLAASLAREFDVDVMMIRYNAAHRGAESDIFDPLGEQCPPIIAYTVTRWGALLKPLPEAGFEEGLCGPDCYRFSLSHPKVAVALCAARSMAELDENVTGVLEGPVSPERLEEIRRFGDAVHAHAKGGNRFMFR